MSPRGPTVHDPPDRELVAAILAAVDPEPRVRKALAEEGEGSPYAAVFALGKAATGLARGAADALGVPLRPEAGRRRGDAPPGFRGLAVRPASSPPLFPAGGLGSPWEEWIGGHPLPDAGSLAAGQTLLRLLASLGPEDRLLALVSGGGSACCELPAGTLAVAHLAATQRALLAFGIPIDRINAVRKHLSRLKGGRALRQTAARVRVLVLSDVPTDEPSVVASGPFAPDPTTWHDALAVVEDPRLEEGIPPPVLRHLRAGAAGGEEETLKPDDPETVRAEHHLLASHRTAAGAAARWLRRRGYRVETGELGGEAAEAGADLVRRGRRMEGDRVARVLSGETTVTLGSPAAEEQEEGHGGRNQELALAAARELAREPAPDREGGGADRSRRERVLALATDGVDGPTPAAGAVVDPTTWRRLGEAGAEPDRALRRHRSHVALARLEGCLLRTGPTGTNVADVALYLRQ